MPDPVENNQISCSREEVRLIYGQLLAQNPLLERIERECKTIGWTDREIRTMQLWAACKSNASLTERLSELERSIARIG